MNYLYLAQGTDSDIWMQIVENDLGCLAQGIRNQISCMNTVFNSAGGEPPVPKSCIINRKQKFDHTIPKHTVFRTVQEADDFISLTLQK